MPWLIVVYLIAAFLVGLWNRGRGNSFWTGFPASCVLTPLSGAITLLVLSSGCGWPAGAAFSAI